MQKQNIQSNINTIKYNRTIENNARFFLVSTPIGNLGDLSFRAKMILQECDLILCEDTRVSAKLLSTYGITTPTECLHQHNETHRIHHVLNLLHQGKKIALISDAGTPLVSDPGYQLTHAVIKENIKITAIPGANAALMALTLSGLPPHPYLFIGFPPPKSTARQNSFAILKAVENIGLTPTYIWHEAPHRLVDMLKDLKEVFGENREAAVARELTKKFEEIQRGNLKSLLDQFSQISPKGEIIVLLAPPSSKKNNHDMIDLDTNLIEALKTMSIKDAAQVVSTALHLPKKIVYKRALELQKI
ncbi:16S rRNA (cytidine(1402)-2'-O)-methyltransferase [Commensalibacter sp. M0134]|uniref:16S rRNA (cytidine(1402)-2'-O)-methyltransferase n=1 Tax=Commensalibacter TaxID=1079922 RepID=UPI0018DDDFCC|nr:MULTISPECIES: 16S rRNA (cytidine(1402)-2'-O)-methyltransferase [Commensalibacter]MBI0066365.1 16S rRNA (cytidine(1402)-2'-O)-methyltransferase [Commensalibacter sp. M0134]MBI0070248.1 16S rRNA (cytidine(1402)-2'-O)-methyltransferase [Commensalibacter sp. M0133]MBI0081680.1 16S rRNA (cytidine(1402)-2'-O)-methyltransferase [Commensalibacter melissae]